MFAIKWEWEYLIVRKDALMAKQREKLFREKTGAFVEIKVDPNTFFIFDKQIWTISKLDMGKDGDIIDLWLLNDKI